jgi:hypothetical protein
MNQISNLMKKVFVVASMIGLSALLFFSGCQKDDDEPQGDPTINFLVDQGYISGDATLPVSTEFKVKIAAFMNNETEAKLTGLKISRTFTQAGRADWDTTLSLNKEENIQYEITFETPSILGSELLEFQIIDENSRSDEISLTITTEEDINSFEMRILGSYDNLTVGSSFASIDGNVYTQQEAFADQAKIDFLYWWGASTSATIGAPDDVNANLVYGNLTYGLPQWTTKNATRFVGTALTDTDFDAVSVAADIMNAVSNPSDTRIGQLMESDVLGFETVDGLKGLIRVKEIVAGTDGQITIDVKVEK